MLAEIANHNGMLPIVDLWDEFHPSYNRTDIDILTAGKWIRDSVDLGKWYTPRSRSIWTVDQYSLVFIISAVNICIVLWLWIGQGYVAGQGHEPQPIAELRVDVRIRESSEINVFVVTAPTDGSGVINASESTYAVWVSLSVSCTCVLSILNLTQLSYSRWT